mmetsp:Transcript_118094/g.341448  ORF Transcript_118094/g.341448 Transcript_118094/m.341448 type:complete len:81 (+) Transcript_118094:136-378(+)
MQPQIQFALFPHHYIRHPYPSTERHRVKSDSFKNGLFNVEYDLKVDSVWWREESTAMKIGEPPHRPAFPEELGPCGCQEK